MVKGGQVGQSLRYVCMDLGIPMKVEIQSGRSTSNSLMDRLGAGPRTKHIDTRYCWVQERVQDGDLSVMKVLSAKKLCRCWNGTSLCFCTATTLQVCRIGIPLTVDPAPPLHDEPGIARLLNRADVGGAEQKTKTDKCQNCL